MNQPLDDHSLLDQFNGPFAAYREQPLIAEWRSNYLAHVDRVRNTDRTAWVDPAFQELLWDDSSVSGIGPGSAVTVVGAYGDSALAARLFDIKEGIAGPDAATRGMAIQAAYDEILSWVYPAYARKRPRARLIRLLASMFPHDMTCLMDAPRVWGVHRLIGSQRLLGEFVSQHAALRQRIREAVGEPRDLAGEVDQSIFSWFLWDTFVKRPDEGAVAIEASPSPKASAIPALSLLPANAQRRSLTCVRDNVNLLVAVVREAEQGIGRDDLINVIVTEASQLTAASASNIISQAQGGLGLIKLEDGAYRPTERGLDLLTSPDPAAVLRAPLIGRVFGMGHLLRMLADEPRGLPQMEVARRLQAFVPTWTTTQPGNFIVAWAKLTGLARNETIDGASRLVLTEDGEEYAAALPADFEAVWRIEHSPTASDADGPDIYEPSPSTASADQYNVDSILEDGCFLPREDIDHALALLIQKKNLVLQGPPGTGKTWLAKRLGYALIGAKGTSRLMAVQFQPSLSYEDFVRGWRPDGTGGLKLADGAFLEAIESAKEEPDRPFVVVIEEINRGNPAQILGELLTLLETDKRNEFEALRLAYPRVINERVFIPPNLYVVGTMNLADRSLALVDLALRRRFAFITLAPALNGAWRKWCTARGASEAFLGAIAARLETLNSEIASDRALGAQFQIGHSFFTPPAEFAGARPLDWRLWYAGVIENEIAPLLNEYWYDDQERASAQVRALAL